MKSGSPIDARWRQICNDGIGDPLGPERRNLWSGGVYQDFEQGQIAVHPQWAGDPKAKLPDFVLSAFRTPQGKIRVRWDNTAPYSYDKFNVRWDLDNHEGQIAEQHKPQGGILGIGGEDPQQIEVTGSKSHGEVDIDSKNGGTYIISVEGCDSGGFLGLGTDCKQGWSFPVEVSYDVVTLPPPVASFPPPPTFPSPPYDMPDGPMLDAAQVKVVLEDQCHNPRDLLDTEGEHEGELKTAKALAILQVIRMSPAVVGPPPVPCIDDGTKKALTRQELLDQVNQSIKDAKVVSQTGTNDDSLKQITAAIFGVPIGALAGSMLGFALGGPGGALIGGLLGAVFGGAAGVLIGPEIFAPGDYDMRLVGLIHIAYSYSDLLDSKAHKHLLYDLLTTEGGKDQVRRFVYVGGIKTPIPESENHILMTESSRYLTNQLRALEYKKGSQPVPKKNDNDLNGLTDWILKDLQTYVQNDFYEYNARPYTFEAMEGISNLYEFAAAAPTCWRSNTDLTMTVPRGCDVRRGARIVMDYHAARFETASLSLRRASPNRRQPEQKHYSRLYGRQSDSMTWRYLALTSGNDLFWSLGHGRLTAGASDLLTPILGEYRVPSMISKLGEGYPYPYFQRFNFVHYDDHPGTEIYYYGGSFLISAGGYHDDGRGPGFIDSEDAWARPTTLMPVHDGLDYRDLIRIDGDPDDEDRVNTCVAPNFACGLNPVVPSGIPEACLLRKGHWIFIDLKGNPPGCDLTYGFMVVVYAQPCLANDCGSGEGSFGFFEVASSHSLETLADETLIANKGATFRADSKNVYKGINGTYTFQPLTKGRRVWGVYSLEKPPSVVSYDRAMTNWPLADGPMIHSAKHSGCVMIDNAAMNQRLVLDFTDANFPKRTRIPLNPPGHCGCPLPMERACFPPRFE